MEQVTSGPGPTLANYQLRLPAYEGPLDVLLRLIERSQLAIEDVSLVAVTDQFVAFVATLDAAPPAVVAEFAAVGARLTVLKSRSLLPKPVVDEAEEPEQSDLTYQLREYKRIKDLAKHLGQLHAAGNTAHGPALNGAVTRPVATTTRLASHDAASLVRSLRRRLTVIPRTPTFIRQRRVISLRALVARVSDLVSRSTPVRFSHVVADYRTRSEVATAFLAVLVLVRRQAVEALQGDLFSDIALSKGQQVAPNGHVPNDEFLN